MKEMFRMVDKSKVDEVKQMLEYTQKGTAKATVGNYMVVLRNDPLVRESMKYNKLTGRIDIVKKLWWNEEVCKLDDDGRTYFYYFFERYYKLTSEKCMDKALRIEANSRAYHPICEYLEQLEWDGQERIRYVLQRYMGADASDFVYEVVKHFLIAAIWRNNTMEFFNQSITVLQTLVVAIGAGLGVWGVVNLMEGYGNDNPGANAHVS